MHTGVYMYDWPIILFMLLLLVYFYDVHHFTMSYIGKKSILSTFMLARKLYYGLLCEHPQPKYNVMEEGEVLLRRKKRKFSNSAFQTFIYIGFAYIFLTHLCML